LAWRNSPQGFGLITRAIHWLMAAALLGMLGYGTWMVRMEPGMAMVRAYGLHKSLGLCLLMLVLTRLVWHRISLPPPILSATIPAWQLRAARAVHLALYVLMLAIPLTGWVGSAASGTTVMLFDRWPLPAIAPASIPFEDASLALHGILTKALLALVILHAAGELLRHRHGAATLRRMLRGGLKSGAVSRADH